MHDSNAEVARESHSTSSIQERLARLKKRVTLDFETRGLLELKKTGAFKYSQHPLTRPTCLSFKLHAKPTIYLISFEQIALPWRRQMSGLRAVWEHMLEEEYQFSAHNAFFERAIYTNILVERFDWPEIPVKSWRCTAAKAAACALPRALGGAGEAMKLRVQKDFAGYHAMMATCKPTKQWRAWRAALDKVTEGASRLSKKTIELAESEEPAMFLEPDTAPEVFAKLYHYCKIDVGSEEELDDALPDLNEEEQEIWHLNQELNWRGLRVDVDTAHKIVVMMGQESKKKLKELDKLTMGLVTKPGARKSILEFLELEGVELPNLQAKTVEDKLQGFELSSDMHRLLEIRKALTMSSTKKYQTMLDRACEDGRVRDILLYHGASTGRDSGIGLQPHNFPKGIIKVDKERPYAAVENVVTCSPSMLRLLYGESLAMLFSSILRNMILPSEGYELFVGDFSMIEVAVCWWLADNKPGLKILRAGLDPYLYMAASNTGKNYVDFTRESPERQLGKAQVLGCFDANTLVLTDRGWIRLVDVLREDKVWDGENWVIHQGVIYQGEKRTIRYQGVRVTPDHQILTPEGWVSASRVRKEKKLSRRSTISLDVGESKVTYWDHAAVSFACKLRALAHHGRDRMSMYIVSIAGRVRVAVNVLIELKQRFERTTGGIPTSAPITIIVSDCLTASQRRFADVTARPIKPSLIMGVSESKSSNRGEKTDEASCGIYFLSKVGTAQILKWTALRIVTAIVRVILDSQQEKRTSPIVGRFVNFRNTFTLSGERTPVFDIFCAGENNRFTILTNQGPMVVHNCQFGMGWPKFQQTALSMYRLKLSDEQSQQAIAIYRKTNAAVPELWKAYENAAVSAVENPTIRYPAGKCIFFMRDSFLKIRLPSGRDLSYRDPQVAWRETEWGSRKTLEFFAVNSKTRKWMPERTWGGTLTENIVQGAARDLIMQAIVRLEKAKYRALLTVHDEGLCERPIGQGSLDEFLKILCEIPPWATGCPVKAEGWKGPRYRK